MSATIRLRDNDFWALALLGLSAASIGLLAGVEPALALAATLALLFTIVVLSNLTAGLCVFIVISFLETSPIWVEGFSIAKAVGVLLALGVLTRVAVQRGRAEGRTFVSDYPVASYALLLLTGWAAVSVLWAEDSAAALDSLFRWALVLSLYFIVFSAVRTRREAMIVIGTFIAGCAITAFWGVVATPDFDDSGRLGSTVGDSNVFAGVLIAGMALGSSVWYARRDALGVRVAASATVVLCFAAFLMTGSRGGVAALFAVLVASVLVAGRGRRAIALLGVVAVAALGAVYFTTYAPSHIRERIVEASRGDVGQNEARSTLWRIGWRMVEDQPILGVGAGNFVPTSVDYVLAEPGALNRTDRVIDDPTVAHNAYLQVQAELGIVGLLLFAGLLVFSIRAAAMSAREARRAGDQQLARIAMGLVLALTGLIVVNVFISEVFSKLLWLLLGLGPALLALAREGKLRSELGESSASARP